MISRLLRREEPAAPPPVADPARSVVVTGVLLAVLAATGELAAHLVGEFVLDGRIEAIDAELEGNLPTWASTAAAAVAAAAAALLAIVVPRQRLSAAVIAAALLFLSLDEAIEIHERLGDEVGRDLLGASESLTGSLQLVFLLPVLAVLFGLVARLAWLTAPTLRHASIALIAGLAALTASVTIEQTIGRVTNSLEEDGTKWPDVIRIGLEEATELAGWLLLAAGLLAVVLDRVYHGRDGDDG